MQRNTRCFAFTPCVQLSQNSNVDNILLDREKIPPRSLKILRTLINLIFSRISHEFQTMFNDTFKHFIIRRQNWMNKLIKIYEVFNIINKEDCSTWHHYSSSYTCLGNEPLWAGKTNWHFMKRHQYKDLTVWLKTFWRCIQLQFDKIFCIDF